MIGKPSSPVKKRHQGYKISKKDRNVSILNEIKHNSSQVIENLKLDLDEAIHSVKIVDGKGFIATVTFETNPTVDDLKLIQVKVPENCLKLEVTIQKMDGQMLNSTLKLPKLGEC